LTPEDMTILQQFRLADEGSSDTVRRLLREALARRPVEQALHGLEARLARIEAAGLRVPARAAAPEALPADELEAIQRVAQAHLRHFRLEDD
jgi:hypothetical protein